MVYKHCTYTKLCHPGLSGSSQTPGVTHLPFSFHLINTRNRKIKSHIHPPFLIRSATPETKGRALSGIYQELYQLYQVDKTNAYD